jgi:tetratricopeptide (TPR) repeat protein
MKILAIKANQEGTKLLEQGDLLEAEQKFRKAIKQAPEWSAPWYNLGLVYKRLRNWKQSFECNQHATQLDPADNSAWWNLGIAATAVCNWEMARNAWTAYGIELPPGNEPIEMNLGLTPIRLNPEKSGEVDESHLCDLRKRCQRVFYRERRNSRRLFQRIRIDAR